jgi:hypothetical protein
VEPPHTIFIGLGLTTRKVTFPADIAKELLRLAWWSTDLRYEPREIKQAQAQQFLRSSEVIVAWVKGRS